MTLPLKADWAATNSYTASNQNDTASAINALGAGTLIIPRRVLTTSAANLGITSSYNVYVHTGSGGSWVLPQISTGTYQLVLFNRGTGTVNVSSDSDEILRGSTVQTGFPLSKGGTAELVSDGTYWVLIGGSGSTATVPTFDNIAVSAKQNGTHYNVPFTWTQAVGPNATGFVIANNYNADLFDTPGALSPTVTFGDVTMPYFGHKQSNITWQIWYGPGQIPEGTQTITLKIHSSYTQAFYGWGQSVTYTNVNQVGAMVTDARHYNANGPVKVFTPDIAPCTILANWCCEDNDFYHASMPNFAFRSGNMLAPGPVAGYDGAYTFGDVIGWPTLANYTLRAMTTDYDGSYASICAVAIGS